MFDLIVSLLKSIYNGLFLFLFIFINLVLLVLFLKRLLNLFFYRREREEGYVLVTGCDSGFGYGTALELNKRHIYVFAGCLTREGVDRFNGDSNFHGMAFILDITKTEDIDNARKIIAEEVKGKGLWCVVNNAGILHISPIEWASVDDMKVTMEVNVWGGVNVTKAMLPLIKETRGRVVNITSMAGRLASRHLASYSMSKYAFEAFSDCLRHEMRPWGVSVHIIEPWFFKTSLISIPNLQKKWKELWDGQPKEIQQDYGEEYYNSCVAGVHKMQTVASPNTQDVINAVCHAVLSSNPKLRYVVGSGATIGLAIASLPTSIGDYIMNLKVKQLIPASVRKYKHE